MLRSEYRFCILCAVATGIIAMVLALCQTPEAKAKTDSVSFINDIAPILKENCLACHDSKKKNGKLDMSSFATLRKGGANDDPIVAGQPDDSEIVRRITSTDENRMPPPDKGMALPKEKVQLIRQWIKEGAKLDTGINASADLLREVRKRWQPPAPPEVYPAPIPITALAFVEDGQRLITSGYHELLVWELSPPKLVERIRTRSERTYGIIALPDDQLAVAGGRPGQEGDVRIYDLKGDRQRDEGVTLLDRSQMTSKAITHLFDTDDCVLALAMSADSKRLAAGGCDRTARVWDLGSGASSPKLANTIAIHADWILGLAFTPDNERLLTASRDKTAKLYNLTKKETVVSFPDHQAAVNGVAVRSDGLGAYSVGADKMLWTWNLTTEKKTTKRSAGHVGEVTYVLHHPTLPFVITASADKSVRIWREDGNPVKTLSGLPDAACSLAISPDGKLVAAGCINGEVSVWKLPDGKLLTNFHATPGHVTK